ncbi:MAG: dephospho-CoA kinase [Bacteroidetes bacterium]|nr:dephospho-CoA kinase [Bacteroidota bacterium]
MLKVGLTGGMGSGKSTVAKIFQILGVPVYFADIEAKRIINTDPKIQKEITSYFGEKSFVGGKLNKQYISANIFSDRARINHLNSIIHPATIRDANDWMAKQTFPYAIKEAALIFEAGSEVYLDNVIGVSSPLPLRLKRIQSRDNLAVDEILLRMSNQMDEDLKMQQCDFVIYNDEENMLIPQVLELHSKLLQLSSSTTSVDLTSF